MIKEINIKKIGNEFRAIAYFDDSSFKGTSIDFGNEKISKVMLIKIFNKVIENLLK